MELPMPWAVILCILIACINIKLSDAAFPADSACSTTKTCWPATCPAGGCVDFQVAWTDAGDYVHFELTYDLPSASGDRYAALGFSGDQSMPLSSIVMCKTISGVTSVEMGTTSQYRTYSKLSSNYGIQNTAASLTGMIMKCTFDRIKIPTQNQGEIRSLTQQFYLLRSSGSVSGGTPQNHGTSQSYSASMYQATPVSNPPTTTPVSSAPTTHVAVTVTEMCLLMIVLLLR